MHSFKILVYLAYISTLHAGHPLIRDNNFASAYDIDSGSSDAEIAQPTLQKRLPQGICQGIPTAYCSAGGLKCSDNPDICEGKAGKPCPCDYDPFGVAMLFSRPLSNPVVPPVKQSGKQAQAPAKPKPHAAGTSKSGQGPSKRRTPSPEEQRPSQKPKKALPPGQCRNVPSKSELGLVCTTGTSPTKWEQCSKKKCSPIGARCECQWDPKDLPPPPPKPPPKGRCTRIKGQERKGLYCCFEGLKCADGHCPVEGAQCKCDRTPVPVVLHNPFPKAIHG